MSNVTTNVSNGLLSRITKSGVLSLGDSSGFASSGGNINFIVKNNKLRFQVNLTSTKKNNLRISAKLLRLADVVVK